MSKKQITEEYVLDEELIPDTNLTAQAVSWPDPNQHNDATYEGYLGDGVEAY